MYRTILCVAVTVALGLVGCSSDMYSGDNAKQGIAKIVERLGYKDPLVSRVEIKKDQIEAFAQHPKFPETLTQVFYGLKSGIGFGGNVQIQGGGTAQDIGFPVSSIDFGLVPTMVKQVKEKTSHPVWLLKIEHGLSSPKPSLWVAEIEGGDFATFSLDGKMTELMTRAQREAAGAHF